MALELPPAWTPMRHHPVQAAYLKSQARFRMLPCGRRSGKTVTCRREVVMSCMIPPVGRDKNVFLCAAPTHDMALRLWWEPLVALLRVPGYEFKEEPSKRRIVVNAYGVQSIIYIVSLGDPGKLEGIFINAAWCDEWSDMPDNVLTSIMPTLADYKGRLTLLGIPKRHGPNNQGYREWCERGMSEEWKDYETFSWPSSTILDDEELELQRNTMSPQDFEEQFNATWLTAGGTCFYNYDQSVHVVPCAYDPNKPILLACDFNVSPMSWCLSHWDGKVIRTFAEISLKDTSTQATLNVLHSRYGNHKAGWGLFGDATGTQRKTSASQHDYAHILGDKRFKFNSVQVPDSNPAVRDRLASCNAALRNAAGEVRAYIDPSCLFLIADMKNRGLDSTGLPTDKKGGDIGHMSDAWGYMVHALMPSNVLVNSKQATFYNQPMW